MSSARIRRFSYCYFIALASFALPTISGCKDNAVATGTVSGKATYNGKPVPQGCSISFVSNSGFVAAGVVDAKGEFKLKMDGKEAIPAATYNISVTAPGFQGPEMTDEDERKFMNGDPSTVAKFSQKKQQPQIPEKYADSIRSGLVFEVKTGSNPFDIDLK